MTSDELFDSYRRTTYSAQSPLGPIHLRVGERNADLERLLKEFKAGSWAYVTAFNPGSHSLSKEENLQRPELLEELLRRENLNFFPGEGVGDDPDWPPEKSVLILDIHRPQAIKLAREFGQHAILAGGLDAVPDLVDCRNE